MEKITFTLNEIRLFSLSFSFCEKVQPTGEIPVYPEIRSKVEITGSSAMLLLGLKIESPALPFKIDLLYSGKFVFNQDISGIEENKRDKIFKVNCLSILYPFLRETVAEITRKAGLQPLLLSPVNFVEMYNQSIAEKNKSLPQPETAST